MTPSIKALLRHLVLGKIWYPVKRKAEKELIAELSRGRFSSFPFISPDTFRALCDIVIEGDEIKRRSGLAARNLIYFDLSTTTGTEVDFQDSVSFQLLGEELGNAAKPPIVIMSHGDFAPSQELLFRISEVSHRVFSINLTEESDRIRAIPLGLENSSRNFNGRLRDFLYHREAESKESRLREVFAAFEEENNPSIRSQVIRELRNSRFGWDSRRLTPERYREYVGNSMFVLSPPGRGLDCHRTWEAVYLGAVPVVLEGSLPTLLSEDLPIQIVSNYRNFLSLSSGEMVSIFHERRAMNVAKAYMPYWVEQVLGSANE